LHAHPFEDNQSNLNSKGLDEASIKRIKKMKMGKTQQTCTICTNGFKTGWIVFLIFIKIWKH